MPPAFSALRYQRRARIVLGCFFDAALFLQVLVEEQVAVDGGSSGLGQDPAIGEARVGRRQLAEDHDLGIDPPGLAERAVGQPDIDADDLGAVQQDAEKVPQGAVGGVETRSLLSDDGGSGSATSAD